MKKKLLERKWTMQESQFNFLGYRISKFSCEISDNFGREKESFSQTIEVKDNFDKKDNRFVEVIMNLDVKTKSKTFLFFLEIKGAFKASEKMTDELFIKLSKHNAPVILFPFARALIASCTAQANIPAVVLPIINLSGISSDKIDKDKMKKKTKTIKRLKK